MQITLKDIAEKMGVTTTTVHKALNGREGVSDKKRAEILKVASEMGYKVNYMAASLARKDFKIAVALPDISEDNRFYYGALWKGIRDFFQTIPEFPFAFLEFTYPFSPEGNGLTLEHIWKNHADQLDGLITIAMDNDRSSYFIEKFSGKGIPVVLIGSDLYEDWRLCCVKANEKMAGCLAAELISLFLTDSRPCRVILTGDFGYLGMKDQYYNALSFRQYIAENVPCCEIIPISTSSPRQAADEIAAYLQKHSDIFAIYSCSARFTVYVAETIRELGMQNKIRVIGNDLFPESAQALSDGYLRAIVDKKISNQSYLASKTLFDFLVKKQYPPRSTLSINPEIVLKSNIDLKDS